MKNYTKKIWRTNQREGLIYSQGKQVMYGKQKQIEKGGRKNTRASEGTTEEDHVYSNCVLRSRGPLSSLRTLKLLISDTRLWLKTNSQEVIFWMDNFKISPGYFRISSSLMFVDSCITLKLWDVRCATVWLSHFRKGREFYPFQRMFQICYHYIT